MKLAPVFTRRSNARMQTLSLLVTAFNCAALASVSGDLDAAIMPATMTAFMMVPRLNKVYDYILRPFANKADDRIQALADEICQRAGMKPVPVYVLNFKKRLSANACATPGAVFLGRRLPEEMNDYELAGVLAHEIAHIKNGDHRRTYGARYTTMLVGMHALLSPFTGGFLDSMILGSAWISSKIGSSTLSQHAEHCADIDSATILGSSGPMADALLRINKLNGDNYDGSTQDNYSSHPPFRARLSVLRAWHESVCNKTRRISPATKAREAQIHAYGVKVVARELSIA